MFVEIPREIYEKLKAKLDKMGILYEPSDCTIPGGKAYVHVEVDLLPDSPAIEELNKHIDYLYAEARVERLERDLDGNGIPDIVDEALEKGPKEVRVRKWDSKQHTLKGEALGYLTGKSTEEEVRYEDR